MEGCFNFAGSNRERWYLSGGSLGPELTQLPRQSSNGNLLLPRGQDAGCALHVYQYQTAAVSRPVRGALR